MLPEIYRAYYISPQGHHPAGRLMGLNGEMHVLEDYYGALENHVPPGAIDEFTTHCLNNPPFGFKIAKEKDQLEGLHLDMVPELATPAKMPPAQDVEPLDIQAALAVPEKSVFSYLRQGFEKPSTLESHSTGEMHLDGNLLTEAEKQLILNNLATGLATLTHQGSLAKAESLAKMELHEALAHLDKIPGLDEKSLEAIRTLRENAVVDPLTGVGNRAAFKGHLATHPNGTWVVSDLNDFRNINSDFGHHVGDQAIQAKFNAAKAAMQEVGPQAGKIFRPMGDEGHYFFHKPEHAYQFVRAFQKHLDAVPHIGGTHKLSVSTGMGPSVEHADAAMYGAKEQKKAFKAQNPTLQNQTPHFHSTHESLKGVQPPAPSTLTKAINLDQDREATPQQGLGWADKPKGYKPHPALEGPPNPEAEVPGAGGGGAKRLILHPNGDLQTPTGQKLNLHIPSSQEYLEILHPDSFDIPHEKRELYKKTVHQPWESAMSNWMELNKRARQGKIPRSIIKLAGLFSAMSPNCLDSQTEALTQRGWIKGFDLKEDDILLTKSAKTGELEWQPMIELCLFPDYEGPLVEIKSRSFCVVTTPEHRWLVTTQRGHVIEKTSETLSHQERIHRTGDYNPKEESQLTPDEAELLGWFVTDGFIRRDNGKKKNTRVNPGCYLVQSIDGNPEKSARIQALLERLGSEGRSGDFTKYTYPKDGKYVWRLGQRFSKMLLKRAPDRTLRVSSLLGLGKEPLLRLREAMVLGDGWTQKGGEQFCTGREEQAAAFQALLIMTGNSSSSGWRDMSKYEPKSPKIKNSPKMTGIYNVSVQKRKNYRFQKEDRREFVAKEPVWCPRVQNTFFVARRMGQVFITGNTGVALQERHFGHVMDMLHEGKMDIDKPINESQVQDFARRAQGPDMPNWNNEFYTEAKDPITGQPRFPAPGVASWEEAAERAAEPNKFGNDKADLPQIAGLRSLDDIMPHLEHMFATHGADGRKMAEELMNMKSAYKRKATATSAGEAKEHFAGKHPIVEGFGPKLTRYMLSMAGAGNILVPDRHMTRSLYNLGKDDPMSEYLATRVVTQPKNEPFLRSLDQHFFHKHPAVKYVLNKYPEHFKGNEEQAIFPAFWLHWLHLPHYERNQGRNTEATIGGTDHKVYWDAVQDSMRKHGIPIHGPQMHHTAPDTSFDFGENLKSEGAGNAALEARAAAAMKKIQDKFGETGALIAYYTYIVPYLLHQEKKATQSAPTSSALPR